MRAGWLLEKPLPARSPNLAMPHYATPCHASSRADWMTWKRSALPPLTPALRRAAAAAFAVMAMPLLFLFLRVTLVVAAFQLRFSLSRMRNLLPPTTLAEWVLSAGQVRPAGSAPLRACGAWGMHGERAGHCCLPAAFLHPTVF